MAFTFFFRDMQTLHLIKDRAVPDLLEQRAVRIWDAGCAMGQEPYSLAIVIRESMGAFTFRRIQIHATDVDPGAQFGPIVQRGIYQEDQIRRIPEHLRDKYFSPAEETGCFRIADEIRTRVTFQRHDLLTLSPPSADPMDIVLCKNVLLHFTDQQKCEVIRLFHDTLSPRGYLAMEQTQPIPESVAPLFEPVVAHAKFFRKAG